MEQTVVQDLIDGRAEPGRVRAISLPHKQPRILIGVHPIGTFWTTVIGKKVVMAGPLHGDVLNPYRRFTAGNSPQ